MALDGIGMVSSVLEATPAAVVAEPVGLASDAVSLADDKMQWEYNIVRYGRLPTPLEEPGLWREFSIRY